MDKIQITDAFLKERPLSYSSLKQFRRSPKHYIYYLTQPRIETDALLLGQAIDILALTPDRFPQKFIVAPEINKRTNEGKREWELLIANAIENKQTVISQEMAETAKRCVESLYSVDVSRQLLENRINTQSKLDWTDKENQLPLTGRIDFESTVWDDHFIVDLKSTHNADPVDFHRDIFKYDYQIQAAMYVTAYARTKFQFPSYIILAVETVEPYNVSVNFVESATIEEAKRELEATLKAFRFCMDNNLFHQGYEFALQTLDYFAVRYPGYYKRKY
jgi:exodeoxyribonuclease VIII